MVVSSDYSKLNFTEVRMSHYGDDFLVMNTYSKSQDYHFSEIVISVYLRGTFTRTSYILL